MDQATQLILTLAAWLLCLLLSVIIAGRKGYPFGTGLLLGFFLGPIGALIVVFILPRRDTATGPTRADLADERIAAIAAAYKTSR